METLKAIERAILKIEFVFVATLLLGMSFLAFAQVVMRNIASYSFVWGDIVVRIAVLWLGILGASIATSERGHIHIDMLTKIVPNQLSKYLDALVDLVATGACASFFVISLKFIAVERDVGSMIHLLHTPEWIFMTIFPVGLGLMSIKFLFRFIDDLAGGKGKGRQ